MFKVEKITVDAAEFADKESTHAALKKALKNGDYIGNNLDALHDALTGIGRRTRLTIVNFDKAAGMLDEYADRLALVLAVSAAENPVLTVIFE